MFSACDDDKRPQETAAASPSTIASVLGIDAAALGGALVDPQRPAGDLAADLAAFTTVEACMKQKTSTLDPLVGDAVDAIGYDTFLRDACRVLEAAKTKDAKKCELIDASALRARCRTVTAMVAGDVETCPLKAPSKPELGRDATCVAAATRSPAMCIGAAKRDRPSCEALVTHDTKKCEGLALDDQRASCSRDATRFKSALVGNATIPVVSAPKGTLTIQDPTPQTADLDLDVGSGVVVVVDGKRTRVTLGRVGESSATPRVTQPLDHTRLALSFATSTDKPMEITEATLAIPGSTQTTCAADCAITVKIGKLEPKRGGAIDLTIDGTLGGHHVHADIGTFVRDVVDRAGTR